MELDYRLRASADAAGLAAADETTLRYEAFLGDLVIRGGGADLSAPWGWVPVLDFALCLLDIVGRLRDGDGEAAFEFTESDDLIRFRRVSDEVEVSSTYSAGSFTCPTPEFVRSAAGFCARLARELQESYPALRDNDVFARFRHRVADLQRQSETSPRPGDA